ncbi:2027_t:CDS:2 [Entrophospora sp. SA101]|nr:10929_t:CDS:2 [Entrophospora sp. SA101]CAJ0641933.1 2027_t:CDS:2 [Entrophospora sp. SA101]CAJ0906788.1 18258_t:CDS:2 [Entrophospora sp. SA101]CAJ0906815.1 18265_t:CDS:2 [Entrophospora sp. SA101]
MQRCTNDVSLLYNNGNEYTEYCYLSVIDSTHIQTIAATNTWCQGLCKNTFNKIFKIGIEEAVHSLIRPSSTSSEDPVEAWAIL